MFTIKQIEEAHSKVKSGADFPKYISDIKQIGVIAFETWVKDSHIVYFGSDDFTIKSEGKYEMLSVNNMLNNQDFESRLKAHQNGETDYFTFCKDTAEAGIEKWKVDLIEMTCTYFDKQNNSVLVEKIPTL